MKKIFLLQTISPPIVIQNQVGSLSEAGANYYCYRRYYYAATANYSRTNCNHIFGWSNQKRKREYSSINYYDAWERLMYGSDSVRCKPRYPGHVYAYTCFMEPYPLITDYEFLLLAFIQLLEKYAYNIDSEYVKFTMGYTMNLNTSYDIPYTLGKAIPLCDDLGDRLQKKRIYDLIEQQVRLYGEKYHNAVIKGVFMNIYYESKDDMKSLSFPNISDPYLISNIIKEMDSYLISTNLPEAKSLMYKHCRIPSKISSIKGNNIKECRPFIVSDIETVLVDNVHVPYAAGYLVVHPGSDLTSLPDYSIQTFFSENHICFYPDFAERSNRMLFDFLSHLEECVTQNSMVRTIYFHNFSRFDGIFLLRYYTDRGNKYKIRPLLRNHRLYELKVYYDNKFLFRFRDSCTLLPGSLESLGRTLCPELGSKGSIAHSDLVVDNLQDNSDDLINYLRQDILILGGVMKKAQEINWSKYQIDIEDVMTVSALSLKIFRKKYLDDNTFHINIPTRNQDTFIRRGFYGGHVDVYKPSGENLYFYDVNSLYPFIMKSYPMPCGVPVWRNNLEGVGLDSLFGFIEAYVVCPTSISRPFLPYKDKFGTLLFPTGKFIGVYYTEELKFARSLGYEIIPLRGYLFEMKDSPFEGFISDLYESRLEAKNRGDEPISFIYKMLMNSLYGRFGINPESTLTEICNHKRYSELMRMDNFQSAEKLSENYYIVSYITNSLVDDETWKAPKMSAVHLAAAITACARIHMYPHINRPDCYYTDTDSIVLGSPLDDDFISSMEMGKFKLEYHVNRGIFLAPKSYMLETIDGNNILKHKGPAKDLVTSEWFQKQFADPSLTEQIPTHANFRIDWKKLQIIKKEILLKLGLPKSSKRENVYDSNNGWIDTRPVNVIDLGTHDATTILKYELLRQNGSEVSQSTTEGQKTTTVKPTLYNTKDHSHSSPDRPKPDK